MQLECKLSNIIDITNMINTEDESRTWFLNESVNETDSDIGKKKKW